MAPAVCPVLSREACCGSAISPIDQPVDFHNESPENVDNVCCGDEGCECDEQCVLAYAAILCSRSTHSNALESSLESTSPSNSASGPTSKPTQLDCQSSCCQKSNLTTASHRSRPSHAPKECCSGEPGGEGDSCCSSEQFSDKDGGQKDSNDTGSKDYYRKEESQGCCSFMNISPLENSQHAGKCSTEDLAGKCCLEPKFSAKRGLCSSGGKRAGCCAKTPAPPGDIQISQLPVDEVPAEFFDPQQRQRLIGTTGTPCEHHIALALKIAAKFTENNVQKDEKREDNLCCNSCPASNSKCNPRSKEASGSPPAVGSSCTPPSLITVLSSTAATLRKIPRKCFCSGVGGFTFPSAGETCCTVKRSRALPRNFRSNESIIDAINQVSEKMSCRNSCEVELDITKLEHGHKDKPILMGFNTDIEKGLPADSKRAVSLGITGMTCSGCERKLSSALQAIPGIFHDTIKTSFLLNRAEFLFDSSVIPEMEDICKKLKKAVGFDCTILRLGTVDSDGLTNTGEKFRVTGLSSGVGEIKGKNFNGRYEKVDNLVGVERVVHLEKEVHEIMYDPTIVGIRDILRAANSGETGMEHPSKVSLLARDDEEVAEERIARQHWRKLLLRTILAALLTVPVLVLAWAPLQRLASPPSPITILIIELCLSTVVQGLAWPFYVNAGRALIQQREIDLDVLVVLSITSAYVYSVIVFGLDVKDERLLMQKSGYSGRSFFETSTLLITLIFMGRLMTLWVRERAKRKVTSLWNLQARFVKVIEKVDTSIPTRKTEEAVKQEAPEAMDVRLLHYSDVLLASEGDRIATDGIIVWGQAEIDEALITGENDPVLRKVKSRVLAGSTVVSGEIHYRVIRLVSENTINSVKRLLSTAATSRIRIQELTDKVASYLTPIILFLACVCFLTWVLVLKYVRGWENTGAAVDALTYAISVLAISCPCALVLSTPMVLVTGGSVGAKMGVLLKTSSTIEIAHKAKHIVFDKTGTLTKGTLMVRRTEYLEDEAEIGKIVLRLTRKDKHPVSSAVAEYLQNLVVGNDQQPIDAEAVAVVGCGLEITIGGDIIRGGKPAWLGLQNHPTVQQIFEDSFTAFCVTKNDQVLAIFGLSATIRSEAKAIIDNLRSDGIIPHILSGDHASAVKIVSQELDIDETNVTHSCNPEGKAAYIRNLQVAGNIVIFVGDGTNDAGALAQADIGICMSNSTDLAASAADVAILSDTLEAVPRFLKLSNRIFTSAKVNISWALVYNVLAVLLAAGVFEKWDVRIEPQYAGLGEVVSLAPVVGVSLSVGWNLKIGS